MINKEELKKNMLFLISSIVIIIIFFIISEFLNQPQSSLKEAELDENGEIVTDKIIISEIMSSNKGSFMDPTGHNYDWVEIYNGKDHEVNLKNYALSDTKKTVKWVFPEVQVEAHSYLIVYLAGIKSEGLYTNFKLKSSGGEDVVLINPAGKIVDGVNTVALEKNEVMFRNNDGAWYRSKNATPGYANTLEGLKEYQDSLYEENSDLEITEILPRNKGNFLTKAGIYSGYIEITNKSAATIDLSTYTLGPSLNQPFLYKLPDVKLKSGESIAIYTSGKNDTINGEIHASFKLDATNGVVTLSKNNKIVNKVEYKNLPNGIALIKVDDVYENNNVLSPGYANNESGIKAFSNEYLKRNETLVINEVMNYNGIYLPHNGNSHYDWIELYNNSKETINLKDYYLTTNTDDLNKFALPDVSLKSGEYYVIMASGDINLSTEKYKHANFKIGDNESIYLVKDNKIVDSMFVANIPLNYSIGRLENGIYYFKTPTPYQKNTNGKFEISYAPSSSMTSGIYNNVQDFKVTLNAHGTIYYTLDGSNPTTSSKVYKSPLSLSKTTVLKVMALEDKKFSSEVQTYNYVINEDHQMDVFMLSMDPSDFKALQANPSALSFEKAAFASLYEQNGSSFEIPCGIKLFGGSARYLNKKSYALKFKKEYGAGKLNYQVFSNRDYSSYDSLVLRSGSQDFEHALIRDVLMTGLLDGQTSVLVQAYKPVVLYINGNYYGVYNLRERIDDSFISNRQNVSKDTTNIIKIDREVRSGSIKSYDELLNYLGTHNMALQENYDYIKTIVNVQDIADFWIAETWATNNDIVNTRYYQNAYFDNNRWHAIMFDMDYAMYNVGHNYFAFSTDPEGMTEHGYSTTILRNLLKNREFRALYLERIGYQLKNVWNSERVLARIDELYKLYYPEMERNQKRWNLTMSTWKSEINALKNYAKKRDVIMKNQAISYFHMSKDEIERYFGDL